MSRKTYKTIAIISTIVSVIGLVSFLGGIDERVETNNTGKVLGRSGGVICTI